jgi:hypothetical protein
MMQLSMLESLEGRAWTVEDKKWVAKLEARNSQEIACHEE